ncbi:indolepyruvate ferredoxin oxidoreductase family protein [Orrella daihaiensis]|uniref:Indolepyruvate ferredoxin oxidoreductase family protein n=1 Tax=Orrella daihaiensis TaxID=2782176 RepID=A0ABY4AL14_9BURK|nr:indolepyruvate ferredoxin oxidoreductase family protein [Orrella daihaiensis]UOD50985.1 indolepyruvate ferredoxin oxidoreductase family protein [Orrella daihaiensis]
MKSPDQADDFQGVTLQDKYVLQEGVAFMSGMQALVRLPITLHERGKQAGLKLGGYISGYRGSPLGTYDMALESARDELTPRNIKFQPGVNEELAATAVWGSQQVHLMGQTEFDGVFGLWYGKAPGVDRTIDVFRHANNAGSSPHGGVVAIAGDDPNAVSSTVTGCSDYNFVSAGMPLVYPANVQEMLDYGVMGVELSRYSGCWVGMKVVTDIGESSAILDVDVNRVRINWPKELTDDVNVHIRWPDNRVEQEQRLYETKHARVKRFAEFSGINQISGVMQGAKIGIVSAGKPWGDLQQALLDLGLEQAQLQDHGVRLLKLGMIYPLSDAQILEFARGLDTVLIVEEKRGFIEDQIKSILFAHDVRSKVVGKLDLSGEILVPSHGESSPALVAEVIGRAFPDLVAHPKSQTRLALIDAKHDALAKRGSLAARTPYFCSGCPHNSSTKVPEGSLALGGIGCHWLALFMDRDTETFTQMGGEGAPWLGAMSFSQREHVFANLGDGTYHHSGVLAIRAAVYGNANITYKILYNDAVAMTGGQLISETFAPQQIAAQVLAEGVREVVVVTDQPEKYKQVSSANGGFPPGVTIHHRDELESVQRRLRDTPGVTVLLYDQTCAAEKRRRRKRGKMVDPDVRAFINELVCEGCGDCSDKSNCISVEPLETVWGRKRQINQSACNKDLRCVDGFCPSFVTVSGAQLKKLGADKVTKERQKISLPDPEVTASDRVHETVITGIGGTGVITIGAIVAMAARLEGKRATCLDQTGISQKNGAVLSHVRIGPDADSLHAPRVSTGNADLVLGCDMMVAASVPAVSTMSPDRTRVVLNTHLAPHADFVLNPVTADFGEASLKAAITEATGEDSVSMLPATRLATAVFGDAIASNMIVLGYALQKGWIPVSIAAVKRAIELNGVAIKANLAALELGREAAENLEQVLKDVMPAQTVKILSRPKESLSAMIERHVAELTAYQSLSYAKIYQDLVAKVQKAEQGLGANSEQLAKTVAEQAYRLMAYKDEYEVARLYTDGRFADKLKSQFEGDAKLTFHLAPPLLAKRDPVTGHLQKKPYGAWIFSAFTLLSKFKGLRGSALDPFGYTAERKMERALANTYPQIINGMLANLTADNLPWAVEVAGVFGKLRGFGHVKERNLEVVINDLQGLARGTAIEGSVEQLLQQLTCLLPHLAQANAQGGLQGQQA